MINSQARLRIGLAVFLLAPAAERLQTLRAKQVKEGRGVSVEFTTPGSVSREQVFAVELR
ncbi:hypothetical protein [Novipirellula artificiosorum]|uniref:hypothetical protein n=1 Tax=Novipirellula artificiosorum TaxID=2528016 RepID=UPI0011B74DD1|nr:hypothetical protein [Novipirellula artificiosorum]